MTDRTMDETLVDVTFNACPDNLQRVRKLVRTRALEAGCGEALAGQLVLVVDEACANIIRHGYNGDRSGAIRLQLQRQDGNLEFRLRDYAEPVDPSCLRPRDLAQCRPGGLGLNFIDSVMDEWGFERPASGEGNLLLMRRKID